MPLHPHKSRRKRFENAITAALLSLTIMGVSGAMLAANPHGPSWSELLSKFWPVLFASMVGLAGLVTYVRKGDR